MLLRPFLNDAGSCASYLFGCTIAPQARGGRPARRSRRGLSRCGGSDRLADRRRLRDPCAGRPCVGPAGCWSSAPARPRISRPEPVSSSIISRSPTAMRSSWETRSLRRSPRRATRRPITRTRSRTCGAATRAVARLQRRLAADRRRGPPRPARRGRRPRSGAAAAREPEAAPRAARPRRSLPEPLRRLGLRPRPLRQSGLLDRLRARPQPDARRCRRGRLRRCAARGHAAAAGRAGADRRRQPRPATAGAPA